MLKRKKLLEADDALDFGIDVEDTAEDLDNDIEDADNDIEDDMEDTESKESSIVIEKIISPEELSAVKIGGHDDESILDLDTPITTSVFLYFDNLSNTSVLFISVSSSSNDTRKFVSAIFLQYSWYISKVEKNLSFLPLVGNLISNFISLKF